jgi:hypothetical protein|tara:strand:- start:590 stop:910 length:321 start_codon:yes stop_codon:yes gene_type:complete
MSETNKLSLPPYQPYNLTVRKRKMMFNDWIDSPIENMNGVVTENDQPVSHGDYIKYFHRNLKNILKSNNVSINNEKGFKNEIATFIYRISEEPENAVYKKKKKQTN